MEQVLWSGLLRSYIVLRFEVVVRNWLRSGHGPKLVKKMERV